LSGNERKEYSRDEQVEEDEMGAGSFIGVKNCSPVKTFPSSFARIEVSISSFGWISMQH
jgi:hypothetical protein